MRGSTIEHLTKDKIFTIDEVCRAGKKSYYIATDIGGNVHEIPFKRMTEFKVISMPKSPEQLMEELLKEIRKKDEDLNSSPTALIQDTSLIHDLFDSERLVKIHSCSVSLWMFVEVAINIKYENIITIAFQRRYKSHDHSQERIIQRVRSLLNKYLKLGYEIKSISVRVNSSSN